MKKILSVTLAVLFLLALATPAFAAQTAKMTVTASKTQLNPGDKVTFTVSVTKTENVTTGGFQFSFDQNIFSYESGKSLPALKGYMAGVSTAANKLAGFFMNGSKTLEGELFSVTLQVRSDAPSGTYTVTGKPSLTASDKIDCTVADAQVTVTAGAAAPDKEKPTTPSSPTPNQERPTVPSVPLPTDPIAGQLPDAGTPPQQEQPPVSGDASEPVTQQQTLPQPQAQVEGAPQKPSFPWWIVAVIAVVAAGGAVFLILEIKKTKKGQ